MIGLSSAQVSRIISGLRRSGYIRWELAEEEVTRRRMYSTLERDDEDAEVNDVAREYADRERDFDFSDEGV